MTSLISLRRAAMPSVALVLFSGAVSAQTAAAPAAAPAAPAAAPAAPAAAPAAPAAAPAAPAAAPVAPAAAPVAPAEAAAPAAPAATPAAPAEAAAPATPAAPVVAEPPVAEPLPMPEAPPAEPAAEEEASKDSPLSLFMFADANYSLTTSHRDGAVPYHRAYAGNGADGVTANGFQMEWIGLDATYDGGEVSASVSLRFGDGVNVFYGDSLNGVPAIGSTSGAAVAAMTQGYLSWAPNDSISFDLGQFGTIFGAEVAESWQNLNYTRGGLYYAMQPFWHTGLKANFTLSDKFGLTAMVVNGVNSNFDEDDAPSIALQASLTPNDAFELYVGGLQTIDSEADSSGFDTFLDLVAVVNVDKLSVVLNADYNMTYADDNNGLAEDGAFFGLSAALGYAFTDSFGVAARYEFLSDPDDMLYGTGNADGTNVQTITGTFDIKPLDDRDNLIIRWDNRFETATNDIYADVENLPSDTWFASVLGVVVKMDE